MINKGKYYTLYVGDNDIRIVGRKQMLEQLMYKINMIYAYVDELDDLVNKHGNQLEEILEEIREKKNHNPSDHDSLIKF